MAIEITPQLVSGGSAALKAFVQQVEGWEADFIGQQFYDDGATIVFQTWNSASASGTAEQASQACANALYNSVANAGYGDKVTLAQCAEAASIVLAVAAP
jgi:hypothetical protein